MEEYSSDEEKGRETQQGRVPVRWGQGDRGGSKTGNSARRGVRVMKRGGVKEGEPGGEGGQREGGGGRGAGVRVIKTEVQLLYKGELR